ncbi:MAG: DNA primase, partial [Cyanobacteria bacterium P01_H01_bin.121]
MSKTPPLHPDTIEAVKQRAVIVDIVSEHVVLKKQGKDFTGLCPFHDEKSPSFRVSPSKQFYYCFSCGAGGNSFKFLMELNKASFAEVVLDLAGRYQVPVKTLEPEQRQAFQRQLSQREQLYEILAVTARFYQHALHQPQGEVALHYLQNKRHLEDATIQQFQLGYAPAGWATLYGYLVEQKHYPVQLVEQAGLIAPRKSGTGYYDRFRDRLMIPIRDPQGRVIGFGGRTLSGDEPKYLNSPETELFDKGNTLFGLDQARSAIAKFDRAVVVEGYFDVIALQAAGVTNVVAALGTALSVAQVKQLLRYTESKQIIFNFDADRAGQQATERAIGAVADLAYQGQVQLRVLNLPGGKDADEYLQQAAAADYRHLLDTAPLWLDWQIQQVLAQANLQQADQFQSAVQALVQLLGKLPNAPLRTHYIHRCAELLGQGESRVTVQLEEDLRLQVRGQRWHGRSQKWERPGDASVRELAEAQLLRLYIHVPSLRNDLQSLLRERELSFSLKPHRLLWRSILVLTE